MTGIVAATATAGAMQAAAAAVVVDTTAQVSPPALAHAIGGSLGSALALLLFYPLERARIELQAAAANNNNAALQQPALLSSSVRTTRPSFLSPETRATTPSKVKRRRREQQPSFFGDVEKSSSASLSTPRGGNATGVAVSSMANANTRSRSPPPPYSSSSCLRLTYDEWMMHHDPLKAVRHDNIDEYHDENDYTFADHTVMVMLQQPDKVDQRQTTTTTPTTTPAGERHHHNLVVLPEMVVVDHAKENASSTASPATTANATTTSNSSSSLTACLIRLWQRNELYRGVGPLVLTMAVSNFIFFYVNALCKNVLVPLMASYEKTATGISSSSSSSSSSSASSSYLSLLASCLAGVINVLLTNPLWVANLRIVTGQGQDDEEDVAQGDQQPPSTPVPSKSQSSSSSPSVSLTTTNHRPKSNSTSRSSSAIAKLWREMLFLATTRGWMHLWQGTGTSILLVSNPVIQFFLYEQFKVARIRQYNISGGSSSTKSSSLRLLLLRLIPLLRQGRQRQAPSRSPFEDAGAGEAAAASLVSKTSLTAAEAFLAGAVAKAIATIVTYPLQLTQSVLRLQQQEEKDNNNKHDDDNYDVEMKQSTCTSSPLDNSRSSSSCVQMSPYRGTWDCLCRLYQRDGVSGLFTGMHAKLLQTVLTAAFTFLTYEQILRAAQSALSLLDAQQLQKRAAAVPPPRS